MPLSSQRRDRVSRVLARVIMANAEASSLSIEAILGIVGVTPPDRNAGKEAHLEAFNKKYRLISKRFHPDRNIGDDRADETYKFIQALNDIARAYIEGKRPYYTEHQFFPSPDTSVKSLQDPEVQEKILTQKKGTPFLPTLGRGSSSSSSSGSYGGHSYGGGSGFGSWGSGSSSYSPPPPPPPPASKKIELQNVYADTLRSGVCTFSLFVTTHDGRGGVKNERQEKHIPTERIPDYLKKLEDGGVKIWPSVKAKAQEIYEDSKFVDELVRVALSRDGSSVTFTFKKDGSQVSPIEDFEILVAGMPEHGIKVSGQASADVGLVRRKIAEHKAHNAPLEDLVLSRLEYLPSGSVRFTFTAPGGGQKSEQHPKQDFTGHIKALREANIKFAPGIEEEIRRILLKIHFKPRG